MPDLECTRGFLNDESASLLTRVRKHFRYLPGEKRATGRLLGVKLDLSGVPTEPNHVVFQAYKDGTASCDWHADDYDQVIVSLGATRTMGIRLNGKDQVFPVADGDLVRLPAGVEHAILPDPAITDERISLVFRFVKEAS